MAQIEVIRDPNIEHKEIVMQLMQESEENMDGDRNPTGMEQTKVYGIFTPIIALNGVVVSMTDMLFFELRDVERVPSVKFEFTDRQNIFKKYVDSGADNLLQVQIIPPEDDMYKKINLDFFVTDISIVDGYIKGSGEYKVSEFTDTKWKAFGEISTYELLDKISIETQLGFASNAQETNDKRFISCSYSSYKDLMEDEIEKSGSDESNVYEWWIDLWNNIILCNLYDRINSEDEEDDMKVWVQYNTQVGTVYQDSTYEQIPALYSNSLAFETSDMYVTDLIPMNAPVSQSTGNTLAVTVYEENKKEYISHCILDGDVEKEVFTQYEYAGEVYGDYNYLLASKARELFLNKVMSECVILEVKRPQISLNRGSQVRVVWYDNDGSSVLEDNKMEDLIPDEKEVLNTMGWLMDFLPENQPDYQPMKLNLMYSGQYTFLGQVIRFDGTTQDWSCYLKLVRPRSKKPQLIPKTDEE